MEIMKSSPLFPPSLPEWLILFPVSSSLSRNAFAEIPNLVKPVLGIISVKRTAAEKAFALGAWILDHDQSRLGAEEHLSEAVFFTRRWSL